MLISSMGRYAVLILLDLAEHRGGFVPVRQIAERQELSQKYLARILRTLAEHGLVEGTHGKGGGYRLTREPSDYSIGEIIRAADGSLSCLGTNVQLTRCEVSSGLSAVWNRLDKQIAAVRAQLGAAHAFDILPAVWLASACSVGAGILAAKGLKRCWRT